jgi:hypothetical protein
MRGAENSFLFYIPQDRMKTFNFALKEVFTIRLRLAKKE